MIGLDATQTRFLIFHTMTFSRWFPLVSCLVSLITPLGSSFANPVPPPSHLPPQLFTDDGKNTCPPGALSRLKYHKIAPGETLESIARQYNLISATLLGMNPILEKGQIPVGSSIEIPPYNGIRVQVAEGSTWQELGNTYKVRPDVLFEANGCQKSPQVVFIPGVNWMPGTPALPGLAYLPGYPLPSKAQQGLGYGWQLHPVRGEVFFHSGLDLLAPKGTFVFAVGDGVVAFASPQGVYGNLVVINHVAGKQSRYAHLDKINVKVGQKVKLGDVLGTVGTTGNPDTSQAHLHFEIRYRSSLGWVAENPDVYLQKSTRF
jgi:murein DD-endopeptidase MepM/ murein hydrolase activator NlpD